VIPYAVVWGQKNKEKGRRSHFIPQFPTSLSKPLGEKKETDQVGHE
jgi:hypothetical protein